MNRQEKRKHERKIEKDMQVLKKMSEKDVIKVYEIIERTSQSRNQQMIEAIDRSLTAILIDEDYSLDQVNKLMNKLSIYLNEDILKFKELEKESKDMKGIDVKTKEYMKELMNKGKIKKEIIEDTACKFPALSKTMITNAYAKIKEEFMKEMIINNDHIAEAGQVVDKKETKVDDIETVKVEKEEIKEKKIMSKLKLKKVELEGEYGSYTKEGNTVIAGEVTFNSLEELEEYKKKEIELFNLRMKEIEAVYKAEVR